MAQDNDDAESTPAIQVTVDVTPVNDPGSFAGDLSATVLEDGIATGTATFTDASDGFTTPNFAIVTGASNGTASITTAGVWTYEPNDNFNGSDSFVIQVTDDDGNVETRQIDITITPVNDAPTFTIGATQTVNEDAGPQSVASFLTSPSAGPSDESGQTLSLSVTNDNHDLFADQPSINLATGELTYTLAANANGTATVAVTLSDDGGTANGGDDSTSQTFDIIVNAVNDGPTVVVPGAQTMTAGTPLAFATGTNGISVADIDATSLEVTLTATTGTLTLSAVAGLLFTAGDGTADVTMTFTGSIAAINAALNGMQFTNDLAHNGSGEVDIAVSDLGATGIGGILTADANIAITIETPVPLVVADAFLQGNFIQVGLGKDGAFGSDGTAPAGFARQFQQLALTSDPDKDGFTSYDGDFVLPGSPVEGWAVQIGGTIRNNNNVLSQQIPGGLQNPLSSATEQSVDWAGSTSGLDINKTHTVRVNELFVDVEVSLTNTTASALNNVLYMRSADPDNNRDNGSGTFATTNTIVSQGNAGGIAMVTATQSDGSYLAFVGFGDNARVTRGGFFNQNPSAVFNGTSGLFQTGSNTADEAVSLAFNFPTIAAGETVRLHYRYYLGVESIPSVDLDANDSSGVTGSSFESLFTENAGPVAIVDTDATIVDLDSTNLTGATATITNLLDGAAEVLAVNTGATGITASYTSGVLTLSGTATVAQYQSVLRTLTYDNASDHPTTTARVVSVVVTDGTESSVPALATVSIFAINDAPTLSLPAAQTVNEDTALAISTISVGDAEATTVRVDLEVSEGTLTLATTTGLTFEGSTINGAASVSVSGTISNINAALATLSYKGDADFNGSDSLSVTVSDLGASGDGGVLTTSGTVGITVASVDDTARISVAGGVISLTDFDQDSASNITITSDGTNLTFTENAGGLQLSVGAGATLTAPNVVTVPIAGIDSISVSLGALSDKITVSAAIPGEGGFGACRALERAALLVCYLES